MDNLEKIDMIKGRLGVSYEEAFKSLEECNGDVVQALIKLEKDVEVDTESSAAKEKSMDYIHVKGQEIIKKIKEIIKEGNVNKVIVKSDEKTLVEIPVTAGVAGLVLFPYVTLLAGAAAMYKDYTLEIEKKDKNSTEEL
ncbi:DUF4342 domain-containing protein [Natronospora cellulosivora (SeqCode)]